MSHPAVRTTEQIHDDIMRVTTAFNGGAPRCGELGALWREMARASDGEKQPGWATLAAALLADDYDRRAREQDRVAGYGLGVSR